MKRERGSERERERGSPVEGGSRVFRFGIDLTGWRRRRLLETPRIKCTGTAWWLVPADVVPRGKSRLLESRTPPSAYARSVVLAPRRRSGCLRESPIGPMTVAVRSSECSLSEKRESELLRAGSPARMSAPCDTERRGWARPRASMTTTDDNAENIFYEDLQDVKRRSGIVHLILEHACTGQDDSSPPQGSARGDQATAQRSVRAVSVRLPVDCCAPAFLLRADAPPLAALCQHEPIRLPAQDVIAFTGMLRSSPGVEHVAIANEPYSDILIKVAKSFAKHPGAFTGQLFIEAKDFDAESFGYAAYDEAPHFLLVDTARLVVKVEVLGF